MIRFWKYVLFFVITSGLIFPLDCYVLAQTGISKPITGIWLARQVFDRDRGKTAYSSATMALINKNNDKKIRTFTNTRILEKGLESQLIRFTSPADINGTGFLTIEKQGSETDQFLYLPALRRSRRIVSSQKSHRFVNSDFTYEDMERHPVDNYEYKILGEKITADLQCYELETRPKENVQSQYSKTVSLIAKESFVPIFVNYFDLKGKLIKKYKVVKLELIDNVWTESIVVMEDVVKSHQTYIKLNAIQYNMDLRSDQVSKSALENY